MKTKTKNPIERIGRNAVKLGKMVVSIKEYKEIIKETKELIGEFNENMLVNWEEKKDYIKI